jgi:hypothetical protein
MAEKLKLPFAFTDVDIEDGWLEKSYEEGDGVCGVVAAYRLNRLRKSIREAGLDTVYGGLAGEFYKNSMINQDFPFFGGAPDYNKFYKMKIAAWQFPQEISGEKIRESISDMEPAVMEALRRGYRFDGLKKPEVYLSMGWRLLQARGITLSNALHRWQTAVSPLMERNSMELVYRENPRKLELHRFSRGEVSAYCPELKDFPTDRGLNCSDQKSDIRRDFFRNYAYLAKVAARRTLRRSAVVGRQDISSKALTEDPAYKEALTVAMDMGIISNKAENIPFQLAERIAVAGRLFSP